MNSISASEEAREAFLVRYSGGTRTHYETVLRLLFEWMEQKGMSPLDADRRSLESFGRYLESERGCRPSTVANYLSVVKGYFKFAFIDDWIPKSPAEYVDLPRHYDDDAKRTWLNRSEFAAVRNRARDTHVMEYALVTMLGMLGLRISEALSVHVEEFQMEERGHRILRIVGKGKKPAVIPLPVAVYRVMDAATGDRESGQLLLRPITGEPMNRRSAAWAIARLARECGIETNITPHSFRRTYITESLRAGIPVHVVQYGARHADPRQTLKYDRSEKDHDAHVNHALANHMAAAA